MPLRLWTSGGWVDGTTVMSTGGASYIEGTVRRWPWSSGPDVVSGLTYPMWAADNFGSAEFASGTLYAAINTIGSTDLQNFRVAGAVKLRTLSDGTLVVSDLDTQTDSGGAETVVTMDQAEWATVTIPSPISGQPAQAGATWAQVMEAYGGEKLIIAQPMTTTAASELVDWVTAEGAENAILAVSTSYTDCQTMQAAGLNVMHRPTTYPGNSGNPSASTLAADGMYGVVLSISNTNSTIAANIRNAGLKVWVASAETAAVAAGIFADGADGIYTASPITTITGTTTPPPPPPTGAAYTVFGTTVTSQSDMNTKSAKFTTPIKVARTFFGSSLGSGGAWIVNSSTRYASVTWKPAQTNTNAWGTEANSWIRANVPKTVKLYIGAWHEPEGNTPSGQTLAQWKTNWRNGHTAIYNACVQLRAEGWDVWCQPVVCDWHVNANSWTANARDWIRGSEGLWNYDVLGIDVYPIGQRGDGVFAIAKLAQVSNYVLRPYQYMTLPTNILTANGGLTPSPDCWFTVESWSEYAKAQGKPWAICEIGAQRGDPDSPDAYDDIGVPGGKNVQFWYSLAQRANWITTVCNHIISPRSGHPPEYVTYYDYGQKDPGPRLLTSEAIAAYSAFVARPIPT